MLEHIRRQPDAGGGQTVAALRPDAGGAEAAQRLAAGNDPGVVPERFLIGSTRIAVERRLARPGAVTENFYRELARR